MKKAYAVIGANFGDEGKGLMTDYFCRNNTNVLNIRFNGGCQAGHTVVTSDGKRHVFAHIGAGTFSGADTYLSEFTAINPMLFLKEYNLLTEKYDIKSEIFIAENAPVTLPCDMLINQLVETARDKKRHGSCGMGIYESFLRNKDSRYRIVFSDINTVDKMKEKIEYINKNYVFRRLETLGIDRIPQNFLNLLSNENLIENYIADCIKMNGICRKTDDSILEKYDTAVFEGAQGLLLDCDREEYFPNLTPSHTGMKNVRKILDKFPQTETEVCYITRSYFTRHGAGKFLSEKSLIAKEYSLSDKTNHTNQYQGNFRYGFFDIDEFKHSLEIDSQYLKSDDKTSLSITHLDETYGKILCENGNIPAEKLSEIIKTDKIYKSFGETADNIN